MTMVSPGTTNLVSWWTLDETSGERADSHGTNPLTDVNTVLYGTGKKSNAADFERDNNEALTKTDSASLSLTGSWTISAWIFVESMPTVRCGLITKFSTVITTSGYGIYIEVISGTAYLHGHVGGNSTYFNLTLATGLSTGAWYHVVATWDDATDTLTLILNNGTPSSASGGVSTLADNASAIQLGGALSGGQSYDGLMDETCLYSSVLTADNIEWLYNSGNGRTYSELTASSVAAMMNSYRRRRAA